MIDENKFAVFEDLTKAANPKVHKTSCRYYQRWLRKGSDTTNWYGPYETRDEAWKKCQQIARETGKQPIEAMCCMVTMGGWR